LACRQGSAIEASATGFKHGIFGAGLSRADLHSVWIALSGEQQGEEDMATQAAVGEKIDIGRVIQRGFKTLGNQIGVLLPLALLLVGLPGVIMYLLLGESAGANATPDEALAVFTSPIFWLGMLVSIITGFLLQASVVRAAIKDLKGEKVDIQSNLMVAIGLLLPMIGLSLLVGLIVGIGMLFLLIPGIIAYIVLIVSVPVLVEERKGVVESMKRSAELTKGSRWSIFLLGLLMLVILMVVAMVFGFVIGLVSFGSALLGGILNAVLSSIFGLISAVVLASLYVELRTVKEGATVESLGAIFA
jgi:hypothetical protein